MIPRMDLVGLVVQDMHASLSFYRALGLEISGETEVEGHVEVTLPGGLRLAWDTVEVVQSVDPQWSAPQGGARMSLAFHCGSSAGVDAQYAQMLAAGYPGHKAPWDASWGQRYAVLLDPDGNTVDLFAPLEEPLP